MLSAQCPDQRVNEVTSSLFSSYPTAGSYARADLAELEHNLRTINFYRTKAKAIQEACKVLDEQFGGMVPKTVEELQSLPGVARKTANVVTGCAYGIPTGIIVDTHVLRVCQRLGLTRQKKPEKLEAELMDQLPREEWIFFGLAMILHGRYVCTSK